MKNFKIFFTLIIISLLGCSKDECEYDTNSSGSSFNCEDLIDTQTQFSNYTVVTRSTCPGSGAPSGFIYDTRNNSTAPFGSNWSAASTTPIIPPNWTHENIGQVFGIAIDNNQNIYLASSNLYEGLFGPCAASTTIPQNTNPGRIYKATAPSFSASTFIDLPNTGGSGNGIGNIAFDKKNKQILATNLEDGKIYRINSTGSPTVAADTFDPWMADASSPGIVTQNERVWGIGVNYEKGKVKVYFPRITTTERSIYSITLNANGSFPSAGSEVLEISGLFGTQDQITDIAFSSDFSKMLISERGGAHQSAVMSYNLTGSSWSFNYRYFIGGFSSFNGLNSAGGVDFYNNERNGNPNANCSQSFWSTGNYMPQTSGGVLYGITGINYSGNSISTLLTTDTYINMYQDFPQVKNGFGDVEVFDSNDCLCN